MLQERACCVSGVVSCVVLLVCEAHSQGREDELREMRLKKWFEVSTQRDLLAVLRSLDVNLW